MTSQLLDPLPFVGIGVGPLLARTLLGRRF